MEEECALSLEMKASGTGYSSPPSETWNRLECWELLLGEGQGFPKRTAVWWMVKRDDFLVSLQEWGYVIGIRSQHFQAFKRIPSGSA